MVEFGNERRIFRRWLGVAALVAAGACSDTGGAADATPATADAGAPDAGPDCSEQQFEDVSIPLRDGKSLAAFVRRPTNPDCHLPAILIQTPYNKENARSLWFEGDGSSEPLFDSTDYAFVVLDWRGFYGSAGAAVAMPARGEDGYDAVEWIAAQPWSNGKVGTWGVSALCRVQHWTAVEQPPHLVAAVPIFCAINDSYEQYYPGGVLRREYVDTLGFLFGGNVIEDHPTRDAAWQFVENIYDPADVAVPMLLVAGWYDLDPIANLDTFRALYAEDDRHRLVIGPWMHYAAGGESTGAGRALDAQELEYWDADRTIQRDSLAWFDLQLRGIPNDAASWDPVRYYIDGEERWEAGDSWPPPGIGTTELYLRADGALAAAAPSTGELVYPYDPADPSPTVGGQTLRPDLRHGPRDQAPVLARGDAAVFVSDPLTTPLAIRGRVRAVIDVSTAGADTDVAVRLTDVDAGGSHLMIADGIRRLKLRDSFAAASPVVAGTRYRVEVELTNELAYTFAVEHRVGLIVTSSNSPRFEINPNTGDDFFADATSPVAVDNTLYLDGASKLVLPTE